MFLYSLKIEDTSWLFHMVLKYNYKYYFQTNANRQYPIFLLPHLNVFAMPCLTVVDKIHVERNCIRFCRYKCNQNHSDVGLLQILKPLKIIHGSRKLTFFIRVFSKLKWISRRFEVINYNYKLLEEIRHNRLINRKCYIFGCIWFSVYYNIVKHLLQRMGPDRCFPPQVAYCL